MLTFSDGMKFDTSGPQRITSRSDGLYVVGEGMLIPVNSIEEANEYLGRTATVSQDKRDTNK